MNKPLGSLEKVSEQARQRRQARQDWDRAAEHQRTEPGEQLPIDDTAPGDLSDPSMLEHSIGLASDAGREKKKDNAA